ncbi:SDR family NAD(P)-dependent oxidoreductase [Candidatus Uhrbacteria bacterium]|nr:SDR family NAD(P)-dependent oxidoreductase [Candidatus Uhrbacteria bacterium]
MLEGKISLVTGGAGFIGSHLCERLLKMGSAVVCFDNLSTGRESNIEHLKTNGNFYFIKGDANNKTELAAAFSQFKIDFVFHYAAIVGVKRTLESPLEVMADIAGINNILECSERAGVKKIVFSSSSEVYGNPLELPEREDGAVNAKMPYAVVKLAGENLLRAYWEKRKLPTVALRFFNVYGPRQEGSEYGFVVGVFINQVLEGKSPTIFGDGTQTRDFVFVDDNVEAAICALTRDEANGQVINIGTGRPTTVLELAEKIISISGKSIKPEFLPPRKIEVWHRWPQISKMRQCLDFTPRVGLEEGLKKTYEAYLR